MKLFPAPRHRGCLAFAFAFAALLVSGLPAFAQDESRWKSLDQAYGPEIRPLLERYCHECHAGDTTEAQIDFGTFAALNDIRRQPEVWLKVGEMLDSGQMPPVDAKQPSADERSKLRKWVGDYLALESQERTGDPGRSCCGG